MTNSATNIDLVVDQLRSVGYRDDLLRHDYRFGFGSESRSIAWAAFAHEPADARSACIAVVVDSPTVVEPGSTNFECRTMGAPVVFECSTANVRWWSQKASGAALLATIPTRDLPNFFDAHRIELSPSAIYRAKTRGRFESQYQLTFVDVGLLPLVEGEAGAQLARLLERAFADVQAALPRLSGPRSQIVLKALFWLLAAKILKDKQVSPFVSIDLSDVDEVLPTVAKHYGHPSPVEELSAAELSALASAAKSVSSFSPLSQVTTESLGYLYESSLVSPDLRAALGIHSTPAYLVEYVVSKLTRDIEELPQEDRRVLEPACGHGAFLVGAMRVLKDLMPPAMGPADAHAYLRSHLTGIEIDPFAAEIARLSLTLADIPHPDGWQIRRQDMFQSDCLSRAAAEATILLSNPPYEKHDRRHTKAAETLARCLPSLRPGAVMGVVVPHGVLHQHGASDVREMLVRDFDVQEILSLSDKVFQHSDVETAVIIARRRKSGGRNIQTTYRRVREAEAEQFAERLLARAVATKTLVASPPEHDLRAAEFEEVWARATYRLENFADSGQGLSHKSQTLPKGMVASSQKPFRGSEPGFLLFGQNVALHGLPDEVELNLDRRSIGRPRSGLQTGRGQVLLNYSPVSRGPWRLKALIDRKGHPVTTRFHVIRPLGGLPLELFWAICNSPYANAYVFSHSTKLHITSGVLRALPVPRLTRDFGDRIAPKVREYFRAAKSDVVSARRILLEIDAEVLERYELPPRLERSLLDIFAGNPRPGVPFKFDRYYPDGFEPALPLRVFLSSQESTAGKLLSTLSKPWPSSVREGVALAASGFARTDAS